jgi:hypothetical protein
MWLLRCAEKLNNRGMPVKRLLQAPFVLALTILAACNGTAVVTLTSTASTDNFLAYRVGLTAVQLQTSDGKSTLKVLPTGTMVDLANLTNVSEVLGAASVTKGTYTSALITLDYSSAQIVYDDGSVSGVALTPLGANGQAAGQISVTTTLDPSELFRITLKQSARLALDFKLAASNLVNVANKTVTITPLIAASAQPIDTKAVRIRGPIMGVNSTTLVFTSGVQPFDGSVSGLGQLAIAESDVTSFEVNGTSSTGAAGLAQLAGLSSGVLAVTYGTLTAVDTLSSTGATTSSTDVAFAATQVLAGSSVQGSGFDRITGVVSARSGNTLTIEDATLIGNDATNTFIPGTTIVNIGPNTVITLFGQGTTDFFTPLQVSVGSVIDAYGTVSTGNSGLATLDASAGRIRLNVTNVAGLVTEQGSGTLIINITSLGGRAVAAFDFVGTGADAGQYSVATGTLDLSNAIVGAPILATGSPSAFGTTVPNFTATSLLDPTTIQAELVVDWGAGTVAPFVTFDGTQIDLDARNNGIGQRHEIQVGAQNIDVVGLTSDPLITPSVSGSSALFAIGHSVSGTVENFNSYAAFITQLQSELDGTTLAEGLTALGQYTASTFAFSATSMTLVLNN